MTLQEIKQSIAEGKKVYWKSKAYEVRLIGGKLNDYYIVCLQNDSLMGLTRSDNITMNAKEEDFFSPEK